MLAAIQAISIAPFFDTELTEIYNLFTTVYIQANPDEWSESAAQSTHVNSPPGPEGSEGARNLQQLSDPQQNRRVVESQQIQHAQTIFNIEHIGKPPTAPTTASCQSDQLNQILVKVLMTAFEDYHPWAEHFMNVVRNDPDWEKKAGIRIKAKDFILRNFVGVIGTQLQSLVAIGQTEHSEVKLRLYHQQVIEIVKRTLDLMVFAMLSRLWDACLLKRISLDQYDRTLILRRFDMPFEPTITQSYGLLQRLFSIFLASPEVLEYPLPEMSACTEQFKNGSKLEETCIKLQALEEKASLGPISCSELFEAEAHLADFLAHFAFLINYNMASLKYIEYKQIRNAKPGYIYHVSDLEWDSLTSTVTEKVTLNDGTAPSDAVLLFKGKDYRNSINLSPFIIDYHALTFEKGSMIYFFQCMGGDGSLEFLCLKKEGYLKIRQEGDLGPIDFSGRYEFSEERHKKLNLNNVVGSFLDARQEINLCVPAS